jgi:hypothetical protein
MLSRIYGSYSANVTRFYRNTQRSFDLNAWWIWLVGKGPGGKGEGAEGGSCRVENVKDTHKERWKSASTRHPMT